jgi:diguanylate cyclase (GGDEF)-like protein/PAS domain S-box-containing protein
MKAMAKKPFENLVYKLTQGKHLIPIRVGFFAVCVVPVLVLAFVSFYSFWEQASENVMSQKRSLAVLVSHMVQERLDGLVNLGISLATRPRFIEEIQAGQWEGAIGNLANLPAQFPQIDRLVLFDPKAIIRADLPVSPGVVGQSRADMSWYTVMKSSWEPFITEVYLRGAEPRVNVISVVVPVRSNGQAIPTNPNRTGGVIGILMLQLDLEKFYDWFTDVDLGEGGFAYIADQKGFLVFHPKFNTKTTLVDFSSVPIIQKVITGQRGVERNFNPVEKQERISAYEPVKEYGWGVIVTQPVELAFADRDANSLSLFAAFAIIVALSFLVAAGLLRAFILIRRSRERLRQSEEQYRNLVERINDWVWAVDAQGLYTYASPRVFDLLGYTPEEVIGKTPFSFMPPEEAERVGKLFAAISSKKETIYSLENVILHKDGQRVVMETRGEPILDENGELVGYRGIDRDITRRKLAEDKLRELSLIDELTGLNNRRGFLTLAAHQVSIANRLKHRLILIYVDMDNMKAINDTLGHKFGDQAIADMAAILRLSFRSSDIIARIGGDEFVGLALESSEYSSEKIVTRLRHNLDAHNKVADRPYQLAMSVGVSIYDPGHPRSLTELIEQGDQEMYGEKRKKRENP